MSSDKSVVQHYCVAGQLPAGHPSVPVGSLHHRAASSGWVFNGAIKRQNRLCVAKNKRSVAKKGEGGSEGIGLQHDITPQGTIAERLYLKLILIV